MKKSNGRTRSLGRSGFARLPLAAAISVACFMPAYATDADPQQAGAASSGTDNTRQTQLGEVTVTAQKRVENVQAVPISIDVLSTDKLTEMNVTDFNDWVKLLPSVSTSSSQEIGRAHV